MPLAVFRRGMTLGLALVLGVAATAVADEVRPDADQVTSGNQGSVNVGDVLPGAPVGVNVGFVVTCKGSSHLPAGATIAVDAVSTTEPGDGWLTVTAGQLSIPSAWPATGEFCSGSEPAAQTTPAHLALTAPTSEGSATFDVQFGLSDGAATNLIFASVTMRVVAPPPPPPADATDPVLHDLPADITIHTTGDGAVVRWTNPTATDDTDGSPAVACDPASGSLFDLGTTTVTCTATDDAGNDASATFTVTVVLDTPPPPPPPARDLTGAWGKPLDPGTIALVGHAGRTIPLKLDAFDGTTAQTPATMGTPALRVDRLAGCTADSAVLATTNPGTFDWSGSSWQRNLDTSGLGTGCIRLTAATGADVVATAIVQLVPETAQPAKAKGRK